MSPNVLQFEQLQLCVIKLTNPMIAKKTKRKQILTNNYQKLLDRVFSYKHTSTIAIFVVLLKINGSILTLVTFITFNILFAVAFSSFITLTGQTASCITVTRHTAGNIKNTTHSKNNVKQTNKQTIFVYKLR